jgi:hypothetical protein
VSLTPAPLAYTEGLEVRFKANHSVNGPSTLNVNGLGAVPLVKNVNSSLGNCDIAAGQIVYAVYDGSSFQLISPLYSSAASANAGPDQVVFGSGTTLAAMDPAPSAGTWSIQSGVGGSFASSSQFNSTFSGPLGVTYTLRWTVTNSCGSVAFDEMTVSFQTPTKRVFMTASSGTGNLNTWTNAGGLSGLAAADRICKFDSNNPLGAGNGNWKAWLSTTTVDAKDRIQDAVYKQVDNVTIIANNKADLTDGTIVNPISTLSNIPVFTGTNPSGNYDGPPFFGNLSPNANCSEWTTSANSGTNGIYGRSNATNSEWTLYTFNYGCNPSVGGSVSGVALSPGVFGRIYCFED